MVFENGVKNIKAAAYNGARTVLTIVFYTFLTNVYRIVLFSTNRWPLDVLTFLVTLN
jgi:hypothetical protein